MTELCKPLFCGSAWKGYITTPSGACFKQLAIPLDSAEMYSSWFVRGGLMPLYEFLEKDVRERCLFSTWQRYHVSLPQLSNVLYMSKLGLGLGTSQVLYSFIFLSQVPKKPKLKKSSSISSPIRDKKSLDHSAHSPFSSPRQGKNTMAVKSKEAEDRHGYMGFLGDPKKSSSSPELSSPPAPHKGIFLSRVLYFVLLLKLLCILIIFLYIPFLSWISL